MSEKEDNQNFMGDDAPELPTVTTTETTPTAPIALSLNLFGNGGTQLPYTFNLFGGGPQPPPPLNLFGGREGPQPPPPLNLFGGGEPRPPPLDLTSCMHGNDPDKHDPHDPRFLTPLDLSGCSFYSSCPIETAQNHLEDLLKAMSPRSKVEHEAQAKIDEMNARRLIEKGPLKAKSKMKKSLSWSDHIGEALEMIKEISPRPDSSMFTTFVTSCADTLSYVSGDGCATPRVSSGSNGSPPVLIGSGDGSPRASSGGGGGGGDATPHLSNTENMYSEYINLFEHLR